MKKARFAIVVCAMLLAGLPALAQDQSGSPKDAYYKAVPITKIWMNEFGYIVQFFNSKSHISTIYVPLTWFNKGPASKAEINYGNQPGYPYFVVVWVDGKFDHIRLFVLNDYHSQTWGVWEGVGDISSRFNVEDVPLEF
jgi:hypothetical protein